MLLKHDLPADGILFTPVVAYFHDFYTKWCDLENPVRFLFTLKNDDGTRPHNQISEAMYLLHDILEEDFKLLSALHPEKTFTVCGVPRSKAEGNYRKDQMGLKRTIRHAALVAGLRDGLEYLVRTTDTFTTHRKRCVEGGGMGELPRKGLVHDTCCLSPEIAGKDIILVDDIYTRTVGIDEDAIQAVFDCGARSVTFYAVGYTKRSARGRLREQLRKMWAVNPFAMNDL